MRMKMRSPPPYPERMPLKKGAWSAEEDHKLRAYIKKYGIWSWSHMPKAAGLLRSGKSCRLRWMNYLRPGLKHGNFSEDEVETIQKLHNKLGNRWSLIAAKLPGRSDNEIKNYWHTHLSKPAKNNALLLQEVKGSVVESKLKNIDLPELLPIGPTVSDNFEGYKGIPVSPQLSAANSKSISDSFYGNYVDYAVEEVGSLESYGELPSFWEQPSVSDNFVGNMGILLSPQVSAVNSTSISDPFCGTYTDYAIEEVGSFEPYGELPNCWEQQFSLDDDSCDLGELWGNV